MQTHFLNETSVRTSVNYGINNIKVEFDLPDENTKRNFENFSIETEELDKIKVQISGVNGNENEANNLKEKNVEEGNFQIKPIKENNNTNKLIKKENSVSKNESNINAEDNKLKSKIGLTFEKYKKIEISIPDNAEIKNEILLDFLFDEDNNYLVDNVKINIGKNSKANFILHYYSEEQESNINQAISNEINDTNTNAEKSRKNIETKNNIINSKIINENDDEEKIEAENQIQNFHNLLLETNLEENAECKITLANILDENANSFLAYENRLNENAKLTNVIVDLGGRNKISNYNTKLLGDCSYNEVKNIYLGAKNDTIDINYNIEAIGKSTKCNIESQGALKDSAKKNFKGIIDFKEGSTKSVGKENENCLILSEKARSRSLPVLLCHEEDVNGEHGISSGKPDKNKMFYMASKGISEADAKKLLVKANFNNILDAITNENLKSEINKRVDELVD